MPSQLDIYPSPRSRFFAKQRRQRLGQSARRSQVLRAPWGGWSPDLPPHLAGMNSPREVIGLVEMLHPNFGPMLRPDDGFVRLNPANLPLASGRAVTMLEQFRTAAGSQEYIAVSAGDGGATPITVSRLSAGSWATVTKAAAAANQVGDRDVVRDAAVFEFGAPTRTPVIAGPMLIWTGANLSGPIDEVMCTPSSAGLGNWDTLVRAGTGALTLLRATSVESFEGRVVFLGTLEPAPTGAKLQRLRWTAVGTADPDPTIVGAGYLDFPEFNRPGVRAERLGNKIACYFEDGMAFAVPTGLPTDAFRPQVVSTRRGLLGTNALVAISPWEHFGIFDDGWYLVNASGQFNEVGTLLGPNEQVLFRFKETFYNRLDTSKRNRIAVSYDELRNFIRISYPTAGADDNEEIVILDALKRIGWRGRYAVSCWGEFDQAVRAGVTIGSLTQEIGITVSPIGSFAPIFGLENVVHGTPNGLVMLRDTSIVTQDGQNPPWSYQTHWHTVTDNPLFRQTANQVGVEYLNVMGPGLAVTVDGNFGGQQIEVSPLDEGIPNTMQTALTHFRVDGTHHKLLLSGTAPVALRSFVPEFLVFEGHSEGREGEVG